MYVPDMEAHDTLVNTARDLFDRFGFVYGSYTNEHQPEFATNEAALLDRPLQAITFYNADLADKLGRDCLLSLPAGHAEELSNGGVFLYICDNQFGGCDDLEAAREFLSNDDS